MSHPTHLDLGVSEVWLQLPDFAKLLLGVRGGDRWRNDHIITNLPIDWRGHSLLVASLQGVDDPQHLRGVASS